MKIVNLSHDDIMVNGSTVKHKEFIEVCEHTFNSQDIHANKGSVEIVTEYCRRSFRNYGNLKGEELKEYKDSLGFPIIIIKDARKPKLIKREVENI